MGQRPDDKPKSTKFRWVVKLPYWLKNRASAIISANGCNGQNVGSDFWTTIFANSHGPPTNVQRNIKNYIHQPTIELIWSPSPRYVLSSDVIFLLVQINSGRKLRSRGRAEDCARWDAGSPFLIIVVNLRRGGSRWDGWQRDRGSRRRGLWTTRFFSTRGTPRRWLRLGKTKTLEGGITTENQHIPGTSRLPRSFLFVPPSERPSFLLPDVASSRLTSLLDPGVADSMPSGFTFTLEDVAAAILKPSERQAHAYRLFGTRTLISPDIRLRTPAFPLLSDEDG